MNPNPSYGQGFASSKAECVDRFKWMWDGLVGLWSPFLGASGDLKDWSGNQKHGARIGTIWTGGALVFDGASHINVDDSLPIVASTSQGSWVAWLFTTDISTVGNVVSFSDTDTSSRVVLDMPPGGKLETYGITGGLQQFTLTTDNVVFSNDTLCVVGVVQDGTAPVLYFDGIAIAQSLASGADDGFWVGGDPLIDNGRLGGLNTLGLGDIGRWNGSIKLIAIYDRVLMANEMYGLAVNPKGILIRKPNVYSYGFNDLAKALSDSLLLSDAKVLGVGKPLADNFMPEQRVVAASDTLNVGGVGGGALADTYTQNAVYYNITETVGTPGTDIEFDFTVTGVPDRFCLYGRYEGNPAHNVNVDAWDGDSWVTLGTWPSAGVDSLHTYNLLSNYTISGNVKMRVLHTSPGNINHDFFFDHLYVIDTYDTAQFNIGKVLTESLVITDQLIHSQGIVFSDSFVISDDLVKAIGSVLSDTFGITDSIDLLNAVALAFAESFTISDGIGTVLQIPPLVLSDSFSISDDIALWIYTILIKYAHIEDDEYTIKNIHIR